MTELFEQLKQEIMAAERRGLTIHKLTGKARLAEATIPSWLDGKTRSPRLENLIRVAGILGKSIALLDGEAKLVDTPSSAATKARLARTALWRFMQ